MRYYKLVGTKTVEVPIRSEAALNAFNENRSVGRTTIGDYTISTVFLVLDHSFNKSGPPVLFETMVFNEKDKKWNHYQDRYTTWIEALKGHNTIKNKIKKEINEKISKNSE